MLPFPFQFGGFGSSLPVANGEPDPNFANVSLLLHCDGTNGSTTFTDNSPSPKTVTVNGNTQISTAQSKFGGASGLFDGTGDYIDTPDNSDFTFGTGDWTIEFFARFISFSTPPTVFENRFGAFGSGLVIYNYTGTFFALFLNGGIRASTTFGLSVDTWYHIAASKASGTTRFFVDGVQQDPNFTDSNDYAQTKFRFGANLNGDNALNGYIDDVRITKGVGRYTANFTPPATPFPNS